MIMYLHSNKIQNKTGGANMILDISDSAYRNILNDEQLFLPIRWNGDSFPETLDSLFSRYIRRLEEVFANGPSNHNNAHTYVKEIKRITGLLIKTTNHYLNGFPAKAFSTFEKVMGILAQTPLKVYQKSVIKASKRNKL